MPRTAPPAALPLLSPALAPLPRAFFARATETVAKDLLGKLIVRQPRNGSTQVARIVEVEAYLGLRDLASHARRGPTPRAAIMFGPPGYLYVYLIYGMYHCMNFVTEPDGDAGAVLIRAADPVLGFPPDDRRRLAGPGKLCRGMNVTMAERGLDLTASNSAIFVASDDAPRPRLARSARIGVDYAGAWSQRLLRFYVPDNPAVSIKRPPSSMNTR